MSLLPRFVYPSILVSLGLASAAYAQVAAINSAIYRPREFNDVPGSTLTVVSNFPTVVSFDDRNVSATNGFANRHVWRFSTNSTTAYTFNNNDFFSVSMTVTLTANPISPRKEAGFLLDSIGGQGQFIVNSDGHEVVAFGGPFPFHAFPANFNSGDTITLGMTYFLNSSGKRAIIYSANGVQSPPKEFSNLEQGIIDGSTLGGYVQIVNSPTVPTNSATAAFRSIRISGPDDDNDGVADSVDECPNTPVGAIVSAQGCSLNQLVPCAGPLSGGTWRNHGQYVASIAHMSEEFVADGLMTQDEQEEIIAQAAQSNCGNIRQQRLLRRGRAR